MPNLADGIRQSFLNNLGKEGMEKAYNRVSGASEDDEERKRKIKLAALKKHIDNYTVRE